MSILFRVTPVPIPNTKVKPLEADGTARAAVWESRWVLGTQKYGKKTKVKTLVFFILYKIYL